MCHIGAGQLRQINTDKPFEYKVSNNSSYNQARYEALCGAMTENVYEMLIDAGLNKIYIPSPETDASSFVFGTKTDLKNTNKLLLLIHGGGDVRAGQWSRSLIINHSVDHGTQLPYIKRAIKLGYDVLVTNTNLQHRIKDGERIRLDGNESPKEHINSVWEQLIEPALDTIDELSIVAFSAGGVVALGLIDDHFLDFLLVEGVLCLIDSAHIHEPERLIAEEYLQNHAIHFKCSPKKLGAKLNVRGSVIPCQSAGDDRHNYAPFACIDSVFNYLETKVNQLSDLDIDKLLNPTIPSVQVNEDADLNAEDEIKMNPTESDLSQIDFDSEKKFNLKIVSWNVAGLRALVSKNGMDYFEHEKPDIICLQVCQTEFLLGSKCADELLII